MADELANRDPLDALDQLGLEPRQRGAIKTFLRRARKPATYAAAAVGATSLGLFIDAFATHNWWMLIPSVFTAIAAAGAAAIAGAEQIALVHQALPGQVGFGGIGAGATVAADANVEAGASVGMGATVCAGAVVRSGASVGMGATVCENAVIEAGASIGWGVTVGEGAVVQEGAIVGAGSTVERGAVVPARMRIGPGGTVFAKPGNTALLMPKTAASLSLPAANVDPRDVRVDELCDRFESEVKSASSSVDEFLRASKETIPAMRRTCHDLLRRERELRKLADPADQERLNTEAVSLQSRIDAETDEVTKQRLQAAVNAIEDQRKQRALLLRDANRLEAEQTRLVWTLEGLVSNMIRLRTTESGGAAASLDMGLAQLRADVSAVADAVDHVQSLDFVAAPSEEFSASGENTRQPVR